MRLVFKENLFATETPPMNANMTFEFSSLSNMYTKVLVVLVLEPMKVLPLTEGEYERVLRAQYSTL